jgi:hypothetical protein
MVGLSQCHKWTAKMLVAKFKNLRRVLRNWYSKISNLASTITNNKLVLYFLDSTEEYRDLSLEEWNFRGIVQDKPERMLEQQKLY